MKVASVAFASPLPQLNKEFDYLIPEALEGEIRFGSLVSVPFGSTKKNKTGYVVAIKEGSSFGKELSAISSVESSTGVLTLEQYNLCRAIAKRQAGLVGELLPTAVPKRSVRAEKAFNWTSQPKHSVVPLGTPIRKFITPGLLDLDKATHWTTTFLKIAAEVTSRGRSVLIVVPDFRDIAALESVITCTSLSDYAVRISSEDSLSQRWSAHLHALSVSPLVIYGTRGAVFAPAQNLGAILVWGDGDESHFEQGSPYWNTRDVALTRSELEGCDIVFAAHSPSAEVVRLVEIGYLEEEHLETSTPLVRVSETKERLDEETFALISKTLSNGKPVLIQVSNLGYASAISCLKCKEVRRCSDCHTALWIDPTKTARCRNCKRTYTFQCECGGQNYRPVAVGSLALTDQLSKSFPKASVLHVSGVERITKIESNSTLVIATPGAEPEVDGGYEVIVFADALNMIGFPRLRALESACSKWANALAKLSRSGRAIYVGIAGELAEQLRVSNFKAIVLRDVLERLELGLPPATRTLSIRSANKADLKVLGESITLDLPDLRQVFESDSEIAYNYSIATGANTAETVSRLTAEVSKLSKNKKPGQRVFFVNMDDNKVI